MSTTIEALKAARKLIEKPERWTQEALMRDEQGESISTDDLDAKPVSFCAIGAIHEVARSYGEYCSAREALAFVVGNVAVYNDSRTHAEVLAAFDRAILAESVPR